MSQRIFIKCESYNSYNKMKLQKFIENYQRRPLQTPNSLSPDRPYIFKTSESIGTLNSHDEFATDRSFVVKQQLTTRAPFQHLEHLKQLCVSESAQQRKTESINESNKTQNAKTQVVNNSRQNNQPSDLISIKQFDPHLLTLGTPKIIQSLHKLSESISFEANYQSEDCLYEQAPSSIQRVYNKEEELIMEEQVSWFYSQIEELQSKLCTLQSQNLQLQEQLLQIQTEGVNLQEQRIQLGNEVGDLRQHVGHIIQQNIQIQNKIKEILLREQMQRMKFFQSSQNILECIDSNTPKEKPKFRV